MNLVSQSDSSSFQVMAKVTGPICNLDCRYCFYLEKEHLYPAVKQWKMPLNVLESFIRQVIESQAGPVVAFAWQGGEPTLLGVEYFEQVVELQKKYAGGKEITNAFQTNGVLLDDRWCSFFARNGFLIGLSLDGPREMHDKYRCDKAGRGSFDYVMRGMEHLKKHAVEFNTLTAVHRYNSYYPLEVYHFLKGAGSQYMQFIPIVERKSELPTADGLQLVPPDFEGETGITEWSVEPLQYGRFLSSVFDEWVRRDVGKTYVQLFDVALESWMGMQPSLCVFRETCGEAPILEHSGDLYACDHYVYANHRLGNILEKPLESLAHSTQQRRFGEKKREALPQYCRHCSVKFACNGECPKHRFAETPDGEAGLNYLCAGYRHFFRHIDFAMRFMATELRSQRAPANIMRWMLDLDRNPPGRNDPCYCGSGGKYKQCHGT